MYHEVTYSQLAQRRKDRIIAAVLAVLLCIVLAFAFKASADVSRKQAVTSVRDSIVEAALQCAAVEGSYPSSLSHLEQRYGLVINHDDYVINYEWLADNIPPSVTVVAR
ncbi:MAG: hypothetical protein IJH04_09165 [Eggerthellaceae bacterium]|nr:hypothetical protein [Eggerthellaceae bacterium]